MQPHQKLTATCCQHAQSLAFVTSLLKFSQPQPILSIKESTLSEFAPIIYLVLAIDVVISIGVGVLVISKAKYFWEKSDDKTNGFFSSVLLASCSIFLLCTVLFTIVHVWAWAPFNVATRIIPFSTTWTFAFVFACIATAGSVLPVKRAMGKRLAAQN